MDIALTTLRRVRRARILLVFFAAIVRSGTFVGTCLLTVSFVGFLRGCDRSNLYLIASEANRRDAEKRRTTPGNSLAAV